jgi:hypothetical protein
MKFMITIYNNAEANTAIRGDDREEFERIHGQLYDELTASGELVDSNELSVTDAKTVRTSGGSPIVTEGRFTEGKDATGGYYIVDVADIDRAIEIASTFVEARFAPIEVRQLMH